MTREVLTSGRVFSGLLAAAALAVMAFAPAGQPDPGRRPNLLSVDIDFAVKELCLPWLKGAASAEALADRQGVVKARAQPAFPGEEPAYWVGKPDLTVIMATSPGGSRACTLRMTSGDPDRLRAALDKALTAWGVALTPSVHRFPPGAYARRDVLCSPRDGPQSSVLISTGGPRARVPMMVTLIGGGPRDPRCDAQL